MINKMLLFIVAVIMYPFSVLFYMNKFMYAFTFGYVKGLIKIVKEAH